MEANFQLPTWVEESLVSARDREIGRGREVLEIILENLEIARREKIPICQDTGMGIIFLKIGGEVVWEGDLRDAVEEGVRRAVKEGFLRASTVEDVLGKRMNRGDNTPPVIHIESVEGDIFEIKVMVKGFGSENSTFLHLLSPHAGWKGVREVVVQDVREKGINTCPPLFIGIGVGGTAEKCVELSKLALMDSSPMNEREREILEEVNRLGIGAGGLGGINTALRVKVKEFPTHIAGLPVGVSLNCHALRIAEGEV